MHFPHYHKKRGWQIFLLGILLGTVIGYSIVIFMYGKMYEDILFERGELQMKANELSVQNEALLQDKELLQKQVKFTVQKVEVVFINEKQASLDRLQLHQLEKLIKQEMEYVIGQEVSEISAHEQLLISVIENKTYTVEDDSYLIEIQRLSISETIKLTITVKRNF